VTFDPDFKVTTFIEVECRKMARLKDNVTIAVAQYSTIGNYS